MISVLEAEILRQPSVLERFLLEGLPRAPAGSLAVGAGDSYAAASAASYLSSMSWTALDPYELSLNPALARRRKVYFVSVSGMTASNLAAAKAVKGIAAERVAVTANPDGRLLDFTDSALFLPHTPSPRLPGTLAFSLSLLALLKLTRRMEPCDFSRVLSEANSDHLRMLFSPAGVSHFIGNGPAYPLCLYASLKTYEVLGGRAQHSQLEEFSHAALFSLKEHDAVNVVCAFDPSAMGPKLAASLSRKGFRTAAIQPRFTGDIEQAFYLTFLSQLAVARQARLRGLKRPYFIGARKKLAVSDSMIY